MKAESLSRAIEINTRLEQLEREKTALIEILPPTQEAFERKHREHPERERRYGFFQRLFRKEDGEMSIKGMEWKIEITNDDINAMFELRRQETEKLKAELEEL